MKKKFTKERFYKRFDAQAMANFNLTEWAQSLTRASQCMASIEEAFQKAHAIIKDAKEFNDAIKSMRQKQYESQQAELENGTAYIITGERTKVTPEFEKSLKEFLGGNSNITVNRL